jgi:hypothetical protein
MSEDALRRSSDWLAGRATRLEALGGLIFGLGGIVFGFTSCVQAHNANSLSKQALTDNREVAREAGAPDANKIILGDITQNPSHAYLTLFNGSLRPMKGIQLFVFRTGPEPSKIVRVLVKSELAGCTKGTYDVVRNGDVSFGRFAVVWTDRYKSQWMRFAGKAQPEVLKDLSTYKDRTVETQKIDSSLTLAYNGGDCK